jgi:hypothetical protein
MCYSTKGALSAKDLVRFKTVAQPKETAKGPIAGIWCRYDLVAAEDQLEV